MWIPQFILDAARKKAREEAKAEADLRVIQLKGELATSNNKIVGLEKEIRRIKSREFIDIELRDPVPTDAEKRRLYVGAVAGLHNDILRPKLMLMISKIRELMDSSDNSRDYDQALKGGSYALFEIIRWGDLMVSEDKAYTKGENPGSPQDTKNTT